MRAVVITEPGEADVLRVSDLPDPRPGPGDVLIMVAAAGLNRADVLQRRGLYPPPAGAPDWPGLEVSGTVRAVGADVTRWQAGDRVCALLDGGGYAEQVVVDASLVLPVPEGIDLVHAAGLPEVACTVWSNVFMAAGLQPEQTLLVHGGSSGIGTMAIQLGRALGARVAVTAGTADKLAFCESLGAQILIDYREQDFVAELAAATNGAGADVILDCIGARYLAQNIQALAVGGRLVVIGFLGGTRAEINLQTLLQKRAAVMATSLRARPLAEKAVIVRQVEQFVWPLITDGQVRPIVDSTLPLDDVVRAHRRMEESAHMGKILLTAGG